MGARRDRHAWPSQAETSRRVFHRWERFACSRHGTAVMFGWALAEATVWPIIPDFLLLPMVVGQRRRPHTPLAAALAGSTLGGAAWHAWSASAPDSALRALRRIPLVRDDQIAEVRVRIARSGQRALLGQPWSGIGLKVWAPVVAAEGIPAQQALSLFLATRALRMASATGVIALLTRALTRWIPPLALPLAAVYLVLFFRFWWRVTTREFTQRGS